MKMNSILKSFLKKYFPAIILLIVKNYFGLDFLNDFNPFTSETKEYFNGNNPQGSNINPPSEGEGSNRQNNPQDDSINPEEVKEVEGGVIVSGETFEQAKALYEKNKESFEKMDTVLDKSARQEISEKWRQIEEISRTIEERKAEIEQRVRDFEDYKNQGWSEEILNDIKSQLVEDAKVLHEDSTKLVNRTHNTKEAENKLFLKLISKYAEKMKDITNESNNK